MSSTPIPPACEIPMACAGWRADQALSHMFPAWSRTQLQKALLGGLIQIGQHPMRPRDKVQGGEPVSGHIPNRPALDWSGTLTDTDPWVQAAGPIAIVYTDPHILVIDKPAGWVVHPAPGHTGDTVINYLLSQEPGLAELPRAGVIHRLDKDTSGLLVLAKTETAYQHLTRQLAARAFKRQYAAVVQGIPGATGTIRAPIARHPRHRHKMAVRTGGREAITHYRVAQAFRHHAWLQIQLETGRTHQIRVHMQHIGYPLVGDPVYGSHRCLPGPVSPVLQAALAACSRQALHAHTLGFHHPETQVWCEWQRPFPPDFEALIAALTADQAAHSQPMPPPHPFPISPQGGKRDA